MKMMLLINKRTGFTLYMGIKILYDICCCCLEFKVKGILNVLTKTFISKCNSCKDNQYSYQFFQNKYISFQYKSSVPKFYKLVDKII